MPTSPNRANSSFGITVQPTHTFDNAPDLDVLIVPGGGGTRAPTLNSTIAFVRDIYPKLDYLLTVCTGAGIAARAGLLDGRKATTNKAAWNQTTALRPQVNWVSHARWVVDGNIWTTSGVSAGIDGTLAFVQKFWGAEQANKTARAMEYEPHTNASWDPFAEYYGLPYTGLD